MEPMETELLSGPAVSVLNKLLDGGPDNMNQALDMLWILAGELHQKIALVRHLEGMVNRKQLTGLLNDRGFDSEITKEQDRVNRGQSRGGVVVSIDLAGFKRINDTYTTEIGDLALKKFADTVKDFGFRSTDILGNPGGDEFIIIMTNTDLDFPKQDPYNLSAEFHGEESLWRKVNRLGRATRAIPFEFEYQGKDACELIRARLSVTEYDEKNPLKAALNQADEQAKLIKKFTQQYVPGGRK